MSVQNAGRAISANLRMKRMSAFPHINLTYPAIYSRHYTGKFYVLGLDSDIEVHMKPVDPATPSYLIDKRTLIKRERWDAAEVDFIVGDFVVCQPEPGGFWYAGVFEIDSEAGWHVRPPTDAEILEARLTSDLFPHDDWWMCYQGEQPKR